MKKIREVDLNIDGDLKESLKKYEIEEISKTRGKFNRRNEQISLIRLKDNK